jgi:condensin complex subunit 2
MTPIGEPKQFDTVIQSLRQAYPQDKMSEISTSFCFICLLHLANEEGLSIETARFDGQEDLDVGCLGEAEDVEVGDEAYRRKKSKKMGEGERKDRVVGELQALRVYKVGHFFMVTT